MFSVIRLLTFSTLLLLLVCITGNAQSSDVPKFEIGPQFTLLGVNPATPAALCCFILPANFSNSYSKAGIGGRVTYNFNEYLAAEATFNFFPESRTDPFFFRSRPEGKVYQGQFGVKAGKRFKKVGVFAKARPGFVGFTDVNTLVDTSLPVSFNSFGLEKETYWSTDVGGVVEFYPSRNTVLRIDAGDTMIHYGPFRVQGFTLAQPVFERPSETRHNFQLITGFGFRF